MSSMAEAQSSLDSSKKGLMTLSKFNVYEKSPASIFGSFTASQLFF